MKTWKDMVSFQLEWLEEYRVRVILTVEGYELGTLYFEKAKIGWKNKPIIQNGWACVEARVEGLYIHDGVSATPKEIVAYCQELISKEKFNKSVG